MGESLQQNHHIRWPDGVTLWNDKQNWGQDYNENNTFYYYEIFLKIPTYILINGIYKNIKS